MASYHPTAQLKIALTGRCINDCPICFNDTRRKDNGLRTDVAYALLLRTITEAAEMGLSGVYFSGGEPTLRFSEMLDLIRHATLLGLKSSVVTCAGPLAASGRYRDQNRALLTQAGLWGVTAKQAVAMLQDAGLTRVFISVDNSHNTDQGTERAPANRVPTAVVAEALSAFLDAGFGIRHGEDFIGHCLRISVTGDGAWRSPSERMLRDVLKRAGLRLGDDGKVEDGLKRGGVAVKFLPTSQVGAALVLPERLLEKRRGRELYTIRCGNMVPRAQAYDGGSHHQDISINHDGVVSLCGNFMYPVGNLNEDSLVDVEARVNNGGADDSPYSGTAAVLKRLFALSGEYGETAIGEAFRLVGEAEPSALQQIATEGGACTALGTDGALQKHFIDAFDSLMTH